MREYLVAVYSTAAQTDEVVRALEAANVPSTAIRRYHRDDPAIREIGGAIEQPTSRSATSTTSETATTGPRGFWSWLLGEEDQTTHTYRDDDLYGRTIESGNTVLAVDVDQPDAERVMTILTDHHPIALDEATAVATGALPGETVAGTTAGVAGTTAGVAATTEQRVGRAHTEGEETIPLAEEHVEIGKRQVEQPVRVRRYVIERPVEKTVTLQDERVEIERRRPVEGTAAAPGAFEERVVEVHETKEEPVVTKTANVAEEVVVKRETGERVETVRETERKEEVEVERGSQRGGGSQRGKSRAR